MKVNSKVKGELIHGTKKNERKSYRSALHSPKKKNIKTHFLVIMTSISLDYDLASYNYKSINRGLSTLSDQSKCCYRLFH